MAQVTLQKLFINLLTSGWFGAVKLRC